MMTHCLHVHVYVAGNLPIKTLVARQIPTNICTRVHMYLYGVVHYSVINKAYSTSNTSGAAKSYNSVESFVINPRRACAARVTVVVLCV